MSSPSSGRELIEIAIGIERSGITFYDIMARSTEDAATREVFLRLADMERRHIQVFESMLDDASRYDYELSGGHPADYLQALIDSAVFTDDLITSEMATQADSDIKALELGISAEKDSLLFYYQMKELLPAPVIPTIDAIISEEKTHLHQLIDVKRTISEK